MSYDSTFLKVTTTELPMKCFTDHKMKTVGEIILPRDVNLFQAISLYVFDIYNNVIQMHKQTLKTQQGSLQIQILEHLFKNLVNTAIPYRESTGFLQGIPCVVIPPLHALAVYRV